MVSKTNTPGRTRTYDILLRRQILYPTELQARVCFIWLRYEAIFPSKPRTACRMPKEFTLHLLESKQTQATILKRELERQCLLGFYCLDQQQILQSKRHGYESRLILTMVDASFYSSLCHIKYLDGSAQISPNLPVLPVRSYLSHGPRSRRLPSLSRIISADQKVSPSWGPQTCHQYFFSTWNMFKRLALILFHIIFAWRCYSPSLS